MASNNSSGGFGIIGILTIIFIVLKLTENIDWSWWWVFSPVLFIIGLNVLFLFLIMLMGK